jgi:NAD+ synthetase
MPTYHSYPELLTADVLICEEIWNPNYGSSSWMAPSSYGINPIDQLRGNGPIFVINASPFWHGKIEQTRDLLAGIWRKTQRPVFWVNQVGANDDIVTGGYSTACGSSSAFYGPEVERHLSPTFAWLETFCPDSKVVTVDLSNSKMPIRPGGDVLGVRPQMMKQNELPPVHIGLATVSTRSGNPLSELEREPHVWHGGSYETACTFRALCLFLEDYVKKCGFGDKSLIAMSGGIDSAVTGAMASMVLGAENVHFVTMPGPYSSKGSVTDSYDLAKHLGVSIEKITIVDLTSMASGLYLRNEKKTGSSVVRRSDQFNVKETKENLQARLRAIMAMMISNDERRLVISTGNKTEISVGYCTLYGDTCGGINMLGDCWKMEVYELARLINNALKINIRNKQGRGIKPSWSPAVIPETIINKPPSAELAPGQKDTDSLPPYEVLDRILGCFVERQMDVDELWKDMSARANVSQAEVMKVWALYRAAEFKRQQMPPCPKVSERGFGPGRRMPVAAKLTKVSPERK